MVRIPDQDRLAVLDAHTAHWQQADTLNGTPIEIVPGFGRTQLLALRDDYEEAQLQVAQLESDLAFARATRDGLWGVAANDHNGVWFKLRQYKSFVKIRLGARHVLSRTVPNFGRISPQTYLPIVQRFIDHWEKVNAQLAAPLTLDAFTLANLQTVYDGISEQLKTIEGLENSDLPLARETREQIFGDESEGMREETSIVSRLMLYHSIIEMRFPNQPIADSLPDIFPHGGGPEPQVDTFDFGWFPSGDIIQVRIRVPEGLPPNFRIYMREGAVSQQLPIGGVPGDILTMPWSDVTIVDELDQIELRDDNDLTLATGTFDPTLSVP